MDRWDTQVGRISWSFTRNNKNEPGGIQNYIYNNSQTMEYEGSQGYAWGSISWSFRKAALLLENNYHNNQNDIKKHTEFSS